MRVFFTAMAVAFGLMIWMNHRRPAPQGRVEAPPVQTTIEQGKRWAEKGYHFTPLADFSLHARVLSRKRYRGKQAELSPVDLAVGWGPFSDPSVYKPYRFRQRGRWYYWDLKGGYGNADVIAQTANLHAIPADAQIRRALLSARAGDLIRLSGKLVSITGADAYSWVSSLSRTDTGAGSCEVVWVESIVNDGPAPGR